MYVGILQLAVLVPEAHSLKEKRAVVRRLRDRVRDRFGLGLSEVGSLDLHQRAELGAAFAGSERAWVETHLADIVAFAAAETQVVASRHQVLTFGGDASVWDGADEASWVRGLERTGSGDKAAGAVGLADDPTWVPAAWRDDPNDKAGGSE